MSPTLSPSDARRRAKFLMLIFILILFIQFFPDVSNGKTLFSGQSRTRLDQWYIIKIGGNAVGYLHDELRTPAARSPEALGGVLQTNSEMRVVLNRLGSKIEISFNSSTEESSDGRLLSVESEMMASSQVTKSDAVIKPGIIELRTQAGGRSYIRTLNYAGELYGPEGVRRLSLPRLKKPGDKITVQTYIAEASLVSQLTRSVISEETLVLGDANVPTLKVEETLQGIAVSRTVWLDNAGYVVKQEEPGPFGTTEALRTDKPTALAAASGAELPEEMYKNSIVRTNIRLPRAKSIDRLELKLTHKNPSLGWPDMNAPNQQVLAGNEQTLTLQIERPQPPKGVSFPTALTEKNRPYLMPNVYIQSDDAAIKRLAKELVGKEKDIFQAALILERWVTENMKFDLGIVFAPATEIFQDRRGTCVGYATLLATLARADGIPSRIVMGYVYALGMFGGHAWTEILAGEQWIPLDAAIVNEGVADATRFYVVASSLADGLGDLALGPAQQIFGQIDIEIMEYETAGKTWVVPAGAKPFAVEGNRYDNPWLRIEVEEPPDFKFGRLDAVWPDPTVVELEGPADNKATLEQRQIYPWQEAEKAVWGILAEIVPEGRKETLRMQGRDVFLIDSTDGLKSAAAFLRGLEAFIWITRGKDAPKALRQIAPSFQLGDSGN
jgi:hypothetical protein